MNHAAACLLSVFAAVMTIAAQPQPDAALLATIDHLVYATPDLQAGIDGIERTLGVRATPGGQHPGRGTRNALLSLGPSSYLEIIGPDPEQPRPAEPRPFGIDTLTAPRLVTWAAKTGDLQRLIADAHAADIRIGDLAAGSRRTSAGLLLAWRYSDPRTVVAGGVVPFFIDWGATPHPSSSAARGATLRALTLEHPDPERVRAVLRRLRIDVPVSHGAAPALVATIDTARGVVQLR
jgi:Glyoxalase-like domain